jgi:putative tryptophan/tyrosine transport system substrate-binding protein
MTMMRRTIGLLITFALGLLVALQAVEAQPAGKVWRFSFLALTPGEDTTLLPALLERLHELGYREGQNLTFAYRSADGQPERLPPLALELVRARPDVLISGFGSVTARALKAATTTIPIVFTNLGDPVGTGLVESLGRPGDNVTGLSDQGRDLSEKRLQLLHELTPGPQVIAVLMNPDTPFAAPALTEVKAAAQAGQTRLEVFEARTADQVSSQVEAAAKAGATGLLVLEDPLTYSTRRPLAALAAQFRLPTIYGYKEFIEAGGLMSYGTARRQLYRRAAEYVDKIVKGAKPADLPVEQPTTFELVINLKTAQALGLTIPPSLLFQATEVIR